MDAMNSPERTTTISVTNTSVTVGDISKACQYTTHYIGDCYFLDGKAVRISEWDVRQWDAAYIRRHKRTNMLRRITFRKPFSDNQVVIRSLDARDSLDMPKIFLQGIAPVAAGDRELLDRLAAQ